MAEAISYPPTLPIEPLVRPPGVTVTPPGSKSITNRALVLAALSSVKSPCTLIRPLFSEDTEVCITALRGLGYDVQTDWDAPTPRATVFRGDRPVVPVREADLFVKNSGTTMRFLTGLVALGQGRYRLDGVPRMRERPIGDLLEALDQLAPVTEAATARQQHEGAEQAIRPVALQPDIADEATVVG